MGPQPLESQEQNNHNANIWCKPLTRRILGSDSTSDSEQWRRQQQCPWWMGARFNWDASRRLESKQKTWNSICIYLPEKERNVLGKLILWNLDTLCFHSRVGSKSHGKDKITHTGYSHRSEVNKFEHWGQPIQLSCLDLYKSCNTLECTATITSLPLKK